MVTPAEALELAGLKGDFRRIAIAGVPRAGKTTLARRAVANGWTGTVIHTDDLIGRFEWSELSEHVVKVCGSQESYLVEGVRVPHALRKGLAPDAVVWMGLPRILLDARQASMAKAVVTVFNEWAARNRGRIPIVRI